MNAAMKGIAASVVREQYLDEIERAIWNAKRTAEDKWWRRQFYRETARIAKAYSSHRRGTSGARRWSR